MSLASLSGARIPHGGGHFCTSPPIWTSATLPSRPWQNLAFGINGAAAAASLTSGGNCRAAYSTDYGATWTQSGLVPVTGGFGLLYVLGLANGRFIGISDATTDYVFSTDGGQTWSLGSGNPNIIRVGTAGGAWTDGVKAVFGRNTVAEVYSSTTGSNFTAHTTPVVAQSGAYSGTLHVIFAGSTPVPYTSPDLTTWTTRSALSTNVGGIVFVGSDNNGNLVALGHDNSLVVFYSLDHGVTWNTSDTLFANKTWINCAYSLGMWQMVATDGTTAYSLDKGKSWAHASGTRALDTILASDWRMRADAAGHWSAVHFGAVASTVAAYAVC